LTGFYPGEHEVALVTTKTHPLMRSVVKRLALGDLAAELAGEPGVGTLYIPPLTERDIVDTDLMEVMSTAGMDSAAES
jgi:hypothetical protein